MGGEIMPVAHKINPTKKRVLVFSLGSPDLQPAPATGSAVQLYSLFPQQLTLSHRWRRSLLHSLTQNSSCCEGRAEV
jgi:hypothetical protein